MLAVLALVFIVFPLVELWVLIKVGAEIGALNTIAVMVIVSVVGAWLARREGFAVLRRIQDQVDARRVPSKELVDGALILIAGLLLILPGFVSDCVGLLLLFPPTRIVFRNLIRPRVQVLNWVPGQRRRGPPDDVIDV